MICKASVNSCQPTEDGRSVAAGALLEAVLISFIGGVIGIGLGMALPLSVRFFTAYRISISGVSVIVAIIAS